MYWAACIYLLQIYLSKPTYSCHTRMLFFVTFGIFALALSILNEGVYCPPREHHFEMEEEVKEALESSLSQVDLEARGSYMTISRFPDNNWRISCNGTVINFTCAAHVPRLSVVIYLTAPVSYLLKEYLY